MIIVDQALARREATGQYIQTAVIGAGVMGKGIINQLHRYSPGIRVAVVYNRTLQKAFDAFTAAGIDQYRVVETVADLEAAIQAGEPAITQNLELLYQTEPLDVLIEATGAMEFSARLIFQAIEHGKHVLSFNAELDGTLGPLIAHRARQAGVKYCVGEGDQPGVTMNLYREVKMRGFEPKVAINIKGMLDQYRTPATQESFAAQWDMTPAMVCSFADGTKVSLEQAVIANATGFKVNRRGMNGFEHRGGHIDDMTDRYDLDELNQLGGIVDFALGPKPGPGVAIFATAADDSMVRRYLRYGKMGDGPLYSFYIPYHLLFFEMGSSVARLVDFDDLVIAAQAGPEVEVISLAKTDLKPGDELDGFGGFKAYGECENYQTARAENLLPIGLADGIKVVNEVAKDQPLTMADVAFENRYLLDLYQEQQQLFPAAEKTLS